MDHAAMSSQTLIISNYDPASDEVIFTNDIGCWNVSRALRDCNGGMHKCYLLDVAKAHTANAAVEVDEAKVHTFMQLPEVFQWPLLGIIEGGPVWIIDGHHRLRAMHRLGVQDFAAYVIEEKDAGPYQVRFNGQRLLQSGMKNIFC